jgi:tetratricopeptide (TPR) repeat protein
LERAEKQLIEHPLEGDLLHQIDITKVDTCLDLAKRSSGAKQSIYYKLAKEALDGMNSENDVLLLRAELSLSQSDYSIATTLCKQLIASARTQQITKSCELAKAHYILAKAYLAHRRNDEAEIELAAALEAHLDDRGNSELPLHLYMEMSRLLEEKSNFEGAIKALSNAINAPIISPMRLEAMQMRADLFNRMGRSDLAHRQQLALKQIQRGKL